MHIFCLCVVKNEADVLEQSVGAAARWADGIFISDNQSDDETPAVIDRLVARHPNVFNAGAIVEPFTDDMRGTIFNRVKGISRQGDWWGKLDADEFFIDDPREFLSQVPKETDTVWGSFYTFYFTEEDLRRYEQDPVGFLATPVTERLNYYRNNESEIRFVKHAFPLIWTREWPKFRCAAYPERIKVAHYRYRSPEQIVRRLGVRRTVAQRTRGGLFPHELGTVPSGASASLAAGTQTAVNRASYLERVVPIDGLDCRRGGRWVARESELRAITDVWPTAVPFSIWKPFWMARAYLRISRYVPGRLKRLLRSRGARP